MNDRVISQLKCAENLSLLLQDLSTLQAKQMFFLGGFIKSGTTWVERLLDAHPEIACKGEAHFGSLLEPALRSGISGYNKIIPDKGNWERLNDEEVHSAETTEYCYTEQEFDDILSLVIRLLMSKWCSKDNLRAVGEKTPNNARYFQRLLQLFPEARHIYIIRDVRDIIVSGWFFNLALDAESTRGKFESIHHYAVYIAQTWVQEIADSRE